MKQKGKKILIVEDEFLIAMRIQISFNQAGHEAYKFVSNGADAIKSVKVDHPDIILMDIRLAGDMDGIETAREIKSFSDVPIIFLTGYSDREILARAKAIEPAAIFDKTSSISEVAEFIGSGFGGTTH